MIFRFTFLLAMAWQLVGAESNSCSQSLSISSQSEADSLAHCTTLDGSLTIAPSANGTITLNNVEEIKGSFTAEGVSGLTKLVVPDLDTLDGAMTIVHLESLTTLSMSALSQISSGLTISGNANLKSLDLEKLEEVNGELQLVGSFTSISLPSLDQVKGQTTIKGSGSMSCSALSKLQSQGVYKGGYSCISDGSSSLTTGTKVGIALGIIFGVLLSLLVLWLVLRQRRQRKGKDTQLEPAVALAPSVTTEEKPLSLDYKPVLSDQLRPLVPRKPIGPSPALLDSRSIYEAAHAVSPVREYHELDAGPVSGSHQRPINAEA